MSYDWKDGLLFAAGFALVIVVSVALEQGLGIHVGRSGLRWLVLGLALGPFTARRAIFGAPKLPPPRRGAFASMLSIAGLFATLFGMAAFALGAFGVLGTLGASPDFEGRARAIEAEVARFDIQVTDEDEAARSARIREEDRVRHETLVAEERDAWRSQQGDVRRTALVLCGIGVALLGVGALATWARYPRVS